MFTAVAVCTLFLGGDPLASGAVAYAHDLNAGYVAKFLGLPVGEAHIIGVVTSSSYWIRIVGSYQVVGFAGDWPGSGHRSGRGARRPGALGDPLQEGGSYQWDYHTSPARLCQSG
jgi:hypothetical protein